jgi:CBS domain-containing protein
MSHPVRTINATSDIVAAAEMFASEPYRSFPVLRLGQLVGMLRRDDVLGRLLELG